MAKDEEHDFDTSMTDDLLGTALGEEEPKEKPTDTETETVEADTGTETVTEESGETAEESEEVGEEDQPEEAPVVDEAAILAQYGLEGQYKSIAAALAAVKHKEQELQRMQYRQYVDERRAEQTYTHQSQERPKIDPDAFMNDPEGTLALAGFVRRDDVERVAMQKAMQVSDARAYEDFVNSKSDFEDMEPAMMAQLQKFPGLRALPMAEAARTLYALARQESPPPPPKPQVVTQPSNPDKKGRASTSGGKSAGTPKHKATARLGPGGVPMDEFNKMSVDDIDKDPRFFQDPMD